MQKSKFILITGIMISLLPLSGCFPSVYKIDIQQGNIITQDMVNQLRPGMTRAQANYVMGTPLILDPFHANRWDYIYSIQPGGGKMHQENISLFFSQNNQLTGLSGDFLPGKTREEEILNGQSAESSSASSATRDGTLEEQIKHEVDSVKSEPVPTIEE